MLPVRVTAPRTGELANVSEPALRPSLVSLPMYDVPRAARERFLSVLTAHLKSRGFAPTVTEPADLMAHWRVPDLLLSQTCGYPMVTALRDHVRLVAVPHYDAPGCEGPFYRSAIVVRAEDAARGVEDLRGRVAAFNSDHSQSGYNALRATIAPLARGGRFFASLVETGSHRASIDAVLEGVADAAAIDAVTLALALDAEPTLPLRVLDLTPAAPALPFVTGAGASDAEVDALFEALRASVEEIGPDGTRDAHRLLRVERLDRAAFDVILAQEQTSRALGYPVLA